ncbi:MAG: hypothetical protein V4724_19625 [Pseudomonadota bacterium]
MKTEFLHAPRWLALLPLLLLGACAHYSTAPPVLPPVTLAPPAPLPPLPLMAPQDETAPLLVYHQRLRRMTQGELLKELSTIGPQQGRPKTALQAGMILMLTRGSGDLARAQALFDSVATSEDPAAQALKPLAQLMSSYCAEARRLAEHGERLAAQLKENQKKSEQLNDMLEGLKAIERNLPARSPAAQTQGGR